MRAFNKILLLGVFLASLSFAFSTFPRLTDTSAYLDDAKKIDVNLTADNWDSKANLVELSDSKLPANNEKISETNFITRENSKSSATGNNSLGENPSINGSSVKDSISDFSLAGNDIIKITTNNSTLADGNSKISSNSLMVPEQTSSEQTLTEQTSTEQTSTERTSTVLLAANFNSDVKSGYAPLSVQFTDLSKNATGWNWDFGDGNTSREQNPMHNYSTSGTYTVNLTVSNENNTDSKLSSISVLGKPAIVPPPVANFSSNVSKGFVPISIQFIDLSENATAWNWDFGDGNNSNEHNPVHIYSAAGNYTVKLIATNAACRSTKTREISVKKKILKKRDSREQKAQ